MALTIQVTDEDLSPVGLIDRWTSLDCTRRYREAGSGTLTLPASPDVMEILQPGHRLVVVRDGQIWMAGPMEVPQEVEVGFGGGDEGEGQAPPGVISVNFTDDLGRIAGYITWPDPAEPWADQPTGEWWSMVDEPGGDIIRALVDATCGPSARAERRIPRLVVAPDVGVGGDTTCNTRFEGLLEACRRVAVASGDIGFRARQVGRDIVFEVYEPRDLTGSARFSFGLGNLRYLRAKRSAPTVTHALVTGTEPDPDSEDGPTTRAFVEVADTGAAATWWRVERHVDGSADTDDDGELTQAGVEELAGGSAPVELATVTVDVPDEPGRPGTGLVAGRDFDLGDRVAIALPNGDQIADIVRNMHLQATPRSGEHVTSLVGSPEATSDPAVVQLVRGITRRLGRIAAR